MDEMMFCYQCEQAANCTACTGKAGVCGKSAETADAQDKLTGALIGFATLLLDIGRPIRPPQALLLTEGLFTTITNVDFDPQTVAQLTDKVWKAKQEAFASASPAPAPVSDYDMQKLWQEPDPDRKSLCSFVLFGLRGMAAYSYHARVLGYTDGEIDLFFCTALRAIAQERDKDKLFQLVEDTGRMAYRVMAELDKANTGAFGDPEPVEVSLTIEKGPFIVISGHDLYDAKCLLEQTEGKGINVYTHSEMLPAHGYPELKKRFPHLKGNFGTAWQNQQREFEDIPAPVLFTTNCIMPLRPSYADRVFTTSVVSYPGVTHIGEDRDFSPVIAKALELGGYPEDTLIPGMNGGSVVATGFAHHAVLSHAEEIVQAVHEGAIRHFFLIGGCDGMANGHGGMHYILPSRELIASSIETMAQINLFDGLVLLGSCDKIVPGMLMAAARLDIPCILLPGGPMEGGVEFDGRQSDQTSATEAYGMLSAGKITEAEYVALEDTACPGCGSCSYLGTANTMCALSEALGMTLPDGGTAPAVSAARLAKGEETGIKIMELVEKRITARKVITEGSIRNAIKACLAMSGSTNAVMHLTAIAHEAQIDMDVLSEFDSLSRTTPQLAKMNPACKYNIVDFYKDGGVPRLMENLQTLLDTGVMTVTGQTLEENIKTHHYLYPATGLVNHTLDDPFGYSGGVAVLRGNLAPDTGVTKPGAFDKSLHHFEGEAICFDSEEEAEEAILAGKIHEGHVVVIRYEGPKGGPGMREMYKAMKYLYGRGLSKSTALITDGRFSGTNNGCFVGHISPEAAEGGPIAIVRDGDRICIDVEKRQLDLLVSQEEIEARLKDWKRPAPKFTSGWLGLYCKLAASGSKGAIMDLNKLKDL